MVRGYQPPNLSGRRSQTAAPRAPQQQQQQQQQLPALNPVHEAVASASNSNSSASGGDRSDSDSGTGPPFRGGRGSLPPPHGSRSVDGTTVMPGSRASLLSAASSVAGSEDGLVTVHSRLVRGGGRVSIVDSLTLEQGGHSRKPSTVTISTTAADSWRSSGTDSVGDDPSPPQPHGEYPRERTSPPGPHPLRPRLSVVPPVPPALAALQRRASGRDGGARDGVESSSQNHSCTAPHRTLTDAMVAELYTFLTSVGEEVAAVALRRAMVEGMHDIFTSLDAVGGAGQAAALAGDGSEDSSSSSGDAAAAAAEADEQEGGADDGAGGVSGVDTLSGASASTSSAVGGGGGGGSVGSVGGLSEGRARRRGKPGAEGEAFPHHTTHNGLLLPSLWFAAPATAVDGLSGGGEDTASSAASGGRDSGSESDEEGAESGESVTGLWPRRGSCMTSTTTAASACDGIPSSTPLPLPGGGGEFFLEAVTAEPPLYFAGMMVDPVSGRFLFGGAAFTEEVRVLRVNPPAAGRGLFAGARRADGTPAPGGGGGSSGGGDSSAKLLMREYLSVSRRNEGFMVQTISVLSPEAAAAVMPSKQQLISSELARALVPHTRPGCLTRAFPLRSLLHSSGPLLGGPPSPVTAAGRRYRSSMDSHKSRTSMTVSMPARPPHSPFASVRASDPAVALMPHEMASRTSGSAVSTELSGEGSHRSVRPGHLLPSFPPHHHHHPTATRASVSERGRPPVAPSMNRAPDQRGSLTVAATRQLRRVRREPIGNEILLCETNPVLYEWALSQDPAELQTPTDNIAAYLVYYSSVFAVRRRVTELQRAVLTLQRFLRLCLARKRRALECMLRRWRALEVDARLRLQRHEPPPSALERVEMVATSVLQQHMLTSREYKTKLIQELWAGRRAAHRSYREQRALDAFVRGCRESGRPATAEGWSRELRAARVGSSRTNSDAPPWHGRSPVECVTRRPTAVGAGGGSTAGRLSTASLNTRAFGRSREPSLFTFARPIELGPRASRGSLSRGGSVAGERGRRGGSEGSAASGTVVFSAIAAMQRAREEDEAHTRFGWYISPEALLAESHRRLLASLTANVLTIAQVQHEVRRAAREADGLVSGAVASVFAGLAGGALRNGRRSLRHGAAGSVQVAPSPETSCAASDSGSYAASSNPRVIGGIPVSSPASSGVEGETAAADVHLGPLRGSKALGKWRKSPSPALPRVTRRS